MPSINSSKFHEYAHVSVLSGTQFHLPPRDALDAPLSYYFETIYNYLGWYVNSFAVAIFLINRNSASTPDPCFFKVSKLSGSGSPFAATHLYLAEESTTENAGTLLLVWKDDSIAPALVPLSPVNWELNVNTVTSKDGELVVEFLNGNDARRFIAKFKQARVYKPSAHALYQISNQIPKVCLQACTVHFPLTFYRKFLRTAVGLWMLIFHTKPS